MITKEDRCGRRDKLGVSVQSLSHVRLFATPWTAARQAPLSFTISWSSLELMFIESAMPSNHLILCHPLLLLPLVFPRIKVFSVSQFFPSGGQRIGASVSVLPMNIQGWFPWGLTGLISLNTLAYAKWHTHRYHNGSEADHERPGTRKSPPFPP